MKARALYAHVPFCQTICGYCDFYSVLIDKPRLGPLVDALCRELEKHQSSGGFEIETIFVGGGTPTTLPPAQLSKLLETLAGFARAFQSSRPQPLEFTVEANPATVTPETAAVMAAAGVNRVSIGAQSFDPGELRVLERLHSPPQVADTIRICRAAGIEQLNIDLIFAVPGQTLASWLANLDQAIALGTDHLSCYGLTYERGTPLFDQLHAGQVRRIDQDLEAEMYETTLEHLARAGLHQYEISNFARPGRECRHNLVYWRNEPYLAIGPSASGYIDGVRYKNIADVAEYIRAIEQGRRPWIEHERPSLEQQIRETLMMGLRLNEGIDVAAFARRFGRGPYEVLGETLQNNIEMGMIEETEYKGSSHQQTRREISAPEAASHCIRLTPRGRLLGDSVIASLLP